MDALGHRHPSTYMPPIMKKHMILKKRRNRERTRRIVGLSDLEL